MTAGVFLDLAFEVFYTFNRESAMKVVLQLNLPDSLKMSEYDLKMHLGVKLYEDGIISTGIASKMLGMDRADFLRNMGAYGGEIFKASAEEIEQDYQNARQAIR
jgi:predicted HTH domain antitoxin